MTLLEKISGGVGALARIKMTVNDLGKIDLYQWLCLLAQDGHRHLSQVQAVEAEFAARA